jgi:mRNA-degrading endonuclease RelE of RelBE toxin-antitoxin system
LSIFALELSPAASRDLKSLLSRVQREIALTHLAIIKGKPFEVGKPLSGALNRERSYHFGRRPEYRIVYIIEKK